MSWRAWCVALLFAGCVDDKQDDRPLEDGPFTFDQVRRVIVLGDNMASSPSSRQNCVSFLADNDDALFPDFAGKDLTTRLSGVNIVRMDRGGDSYRALGNTPDALCVCRGAECGSKPCINAEDRTPTAVLVILGVNDLFGLALQLLNNDALREEPTPALEALRQDVRAVLAYTQDTSVFPRAPQVVVTTVHDPTDGVGDLAELAASFLPIPNAEEVTREQALRVLDGCDAVLHEEAAAIGATVADVQEHFLGHGYHHDDDTTPHHDAEDETRWLRSAVDPNLRGSHEIRRVLWKALTGESIDAIPSGLPPDATLGLPTVPDNGWANAVVDADITLELFSEGFNDPFTNVVADADLALGAPQSAGADNAVAVGVLGKFVVLDLGAGEEALDGEGADLVVIEVGIASGGTPEPYRVFISAGEGQPFVQLGDGSGERAFDLADVGAVSARFVRIESLALEYDILHGFGSPFYPGPEIDAVGAVHPGTP